MISNRYPAVLAIVAAAFATAGCNEDNSIQSGITVHMAEVHTEARPGAAFVTPTIPPSAATIEGGYDQANLEKHPIRDTNNRTLVLYRAYLVLNDLELVPCTSLAGLSRRLLDSLIPTASAHAGHGTEPVGGRSLDQPNVIDIVTQEGFILPLGDRAVAPGRYCGVRVALVRLAGEAYGEPEFAAASNDDPTTVPEIPDMSGRIFSIRADYCDETNGSGECTRRVKVDVDDNGLTEPAARIIDFDQPLEVNELLREAYVIVGIAYGEWVQDVDVTQLGTSTAELQKLLDNIAASIHVNAIGLGDLPANI